MTLTVHLMVWLDLGIGSRHIVHGPHNLLLIGPAWLPDGISGGSRKRSAKHTLFVLASSLAPFTDPNPAESFLGSLQETEKHRPHSH